MTSACRERPVLTKLDVVKEAGGPKRELTKEFKAISLTDRLTIGFAPSAGEAMLSGVETIGEYKPDEHTPNALPIARIEASALSGPTPLELTFSARGTQQAEVISTESVARDVCQRGSVRRDVAMDSGLWWNTENDDIR